VRVADVPIKVAQQTDYPWNGEISISITPDRRVDMTLAVRIPGWAQDEAMPTDLYRFTDHSNAKVGLTVNGRAVTLVMHDGYATVPRRWRKGDVVKLTLPMPIRRVLANEQVAEDRGKAAIQRGPIVYCLEAADNRGTVNDLRIPLDIPLTHAFNADLLKGIEVIKGKVGDRTVTAVPYFARNNRGRGEMVVWVSY
jgi:hypothetical protein